jgi:hypothetical protein
MEGERISRLLRELPRHGAPAYFTAGVLRRLSDEPRRRTFRRLAAAAAAVAVAVGVFGAHELARERGRERERREALHRLEALEARKAELENEIRSLRRLARDAQPVVYLGSTPSVDVVVDLGRLAPVRLTAHPTEGGYRR